MENPPDKREATDQDQDQEQNTTPRKRKGGLITMPFIIANEAFEKIASYGLIPNMILYMLKDYHMGMAKGTNIIFLWTAASNFTPLLGSLLADSYLGRFLTIGLASITSFLGMVLLWLTAMIPQARPPACNIMAPQTCKSATPGQMTFLVASLALISVGSGGVRPCSIAFGADQFDNKDNPKNDRVLESYFGWYYAFSGIAVLIGLTGVVYIQDHLGWKIGFGVPALLMVVATILFVLASRFYVKRKTSTSLITSFAKVVVAAYKNRNLSFPKQDSVGSYHHKKDGEILTPSNKLRFINKACIVSNRERDIAPDGSASDSWALCTIEQVEELKALIKVIPMWTTGIMLSINVSQNTFQVVQATAMDRHIGSSNFQIPAGSFGMFTIIALVLWVIFYDRAILPLASKLRGRPVRFSVKLRMGLGLFASLAAMVVASSVESVRRRRATIEGITNDPTGVVSMSAMWLVPQYVLFGFAEALTGIGQTEFFYGEFPKTMSSIAAALYGLGMAVASLLASVILNAVDHITSRNGKESWVGSNVNKAHYDYYYWVLAMLSLLNLIYYMVCSWAYGPCAEQSKNGRVSVLKEEDEKLFHVGKGMEETEGKKVKTLLGLDG